MSLAVAPPWCDAQEMSGDDLTWLSQWFLSECNNDWEHGTGIRIETLDNPGWHIRINLEDTLLEGRSFEPVSHGEINDDLDEWHRTGSWWRASVEGDHFKATCGPLDLGSVIAIFRQWAEQADQ